MTREPGGRLSKEPDYKSLVHRWTTEVWNHRREELIDQMASPDLVVEVEGMDGDIDRERFKEYRRNFLNAVPDMWVEILSITSEGRTSFQTWRATGTHLGPGLGIPPSGRRVDFSGATFYEFDEEGLIVRGFDRWNRGETIASLMQVRIDELVERARLTRREAQVALLMAERFAHADIADQLAIKPNTARRHCERVLGKLGVHRKQDVAKALGKIPGSVLDRHGSDLVERVDG
jgi:steroid delta-isomerase-like uncharacterized protein